MQVPFIPVPRLGHRPVDKESVMSSWNKLLTLALLAMIVIACVGEETSRPVARTDEGSVYTHIAGVPTGGGVFRVYDPEMQVYCWIFSYGISCIPGRQLVAPHKD